MKSAVKIPLTGKRGEGRYALVDAKWAEHCRHTPWHMSENGYARQSMTLSSRAGRVRAGAPSRTYLHTYLHRFLWDLSGRPLPMPPAQLDHKNRRKLDCRLANLRVAPTRWHNNQNKVKADGASRYRGVRPGVRPGTWVARFGNRRRRRLGLFLREHDAALAWNRAVLERLPEADRAFVLLNRVKEDGRVLVEWTPPTTVRREKGHANGRPWRGNYRGHFLGYYATREEAVGAVDRATQGLPVTRRRYGAWRFEQRQLRQLVALCPVAKTTVSGPILPLAKASARLALLARRTQHALTAKENSETMRSVDKTKEMI